MTGKLVKDTFVMGLPGNNKTEHRIERQTSPPKSSRRYSATNKGILVLSCRCYCVLDVEDDIQRNLEFVIQNDALPDNEDEQKMQRRSFCCAHFVDYRQFVL